MTVVSGMRIGLSKHSQLAVFGARRMRRWSELLAIRAVHNVVTVEAEVRTQCRGRGVRLPCQDSIGRGVILPCQDSMAPDLARLGKCVAAQCLRRVDFDRIKTMLSKCDSDHPKCSKKRREAMGHPVRARVIGCRTRRLVALTPTTKYVALSYVCGPSRPDDSSRLTTSEPELPLQLPLTIESTIVATLALGFQYLWVDRYCIDQSHGEDKTHQISQMANIYSYAVVTICALGENDDIDLPGVSCDRKKQLRVETEHLALTWTGPSIRRILKHSAWTTRGWTYQETVLSKRCLFFTEYYATLICETRAFSENIVSGDFTPWSFNKDAQIRDERHPLDHPLDPSQAFFGHVAEFRGRKLSSKSDMLHAFKGILSQLQVQPYWGIPVYRVISSRRGLAKLACEQEQEAGFLAGLCWKTLQKESSSSQSLPGSLDDSGFPSWSWVCSDHLMSLNHIAEPLELEVASSRFSNFQAKVAVRRLDNTSISFRDFAETYRCNKVIPEQTRFLELTSVVVTWHSRQRQIRERQTNKRPKKEHWTEGQRAEKRRIDNIRSWRRRYTTPDVSVITTSNGDGDIYARPTQKHHWWQLNTLGNVYLDAKLVDRKQEGHAVLLALDISTSGKLDSIRAVWLAVKKMADGTYRRQGVIVLDYKGKLDHSVISPGVGWHETIVLG